MDLRGYYRRIRETEAEIGGPFAVIVSLATPDGGREGTPAEVPRRVAAKMVVEGLARLASAAEESEFQMAQAEAARKAEQAAAAARVQLSVISSSELEQIKAAMRVLQE